MRLVADIGNSRCHFGLFNESEIIATHIYDSADWQATGLQQWREAFDFSTITEAVIIAVADTPMLSITEHLAACNIDYHLVGQDGDYRLPCRSPQLLHNLGADRAMNILGGLHFAEPPFVALDCGTATTVDYCDSQGRFGGGVIMAGAPMMAKALHDETAKLPLLQEITTPPQIIGDSTESAILSALTYGYSDMLAGVIGRMQALEKAPLSVILCGGMGETYAPLLRETLKNHLILEKHLTLWGGWCYSATN